MLTAALVAALAVAAPLDDDRPVDPKSPHAHVSAVLDREAIAPGETAWLGVSFDIDDGWHLYWHGLNDSGMSIGLTPTLPEGLSIGEWRWPAPKRYVSPGDLLDHVYEGRVTLVAPLHVDKSVAVGTHAVSIAHEWLVCHEACMFGGGTATLDVTIAERGDKSTRTASPQKEWFSASQKRWPSSWTPTERNDIVTPLSKVIVHPPRPRHTGSLAWSGNALTIEIPKATRLVFHAHENCDDVEQLLRHGAKNAAMLELPFEKEGAHAVGVLEVHRTNRRTNFFAIDTRAPVTPKR